MNDDDDNDDFSLVCSSTSTSDDRFNLHVLYTHTPYFHICRLPKEVYTHTHTFSLPHFPCYPFLSVLFFQVHTSKLILCQSSSGDSNSSNGISRIRYC